MGSQNCNEITALTISINKRFMAFAEITDKGVQVVVYDLRLMVIVKNIVLEKLPKNTVIIMMSINI